MPQFEQYPDESDADFKKRMEGKIMPYQDKKLYELMLAKKKGEAESKKAGSLLNAPPPAEKEYSTRKQKDNERRYKPLKPKKQSPIGISPMPRDPMKILDMKSAKTPPKKGLGLLKRKKKPQQGKSGGYQA